MQYKKKTDRGNALSRTVKRECDCVVCLTGNEINKITMKRRKCMRIIFLRTLFYLYLFIFFANRMHALEMRD